MMDTCNFLQLLSEVYKYPNSKFMHSGNEIEQNKNVERTRHNCTWAQGILN